MALAIQQAIGNPAPKGAFTRLAGEVGTTISTVSRWHDLQSSPDPATWPAIEDALGMNRGTLTTVALTTTSTMGSTDEEISRLRDVVAALGQGVVRLLAEADGMPDAAELMQSILAALDGERDAQ